MRFSKTRARQTFWLELLNVSQSDLVNNQISLLTLNIVQPNDKLLFHRLPPLLPPMSQINQIQAAVISLSDLLPAES